MKVLKWIKNKLDAWATKESKELDNYIAGKYREQMKKDCPMLFEGFKFK